MQIGGSIGHMSIELASKYPDLKCIVQDFPDLEGQFNASIPAELKSRVSFQGHSFFNPQPVKGADIYFLKWILHDWSDKYCRKIISQILPVMKPTSRIIVMDLVVPPRGVLPWLAERSITSIDMQMLVACWAKERTAEDWSELFSSVDKRLKVKSAKTTPGANLGLVEVVLEG